MGKDALDARPEHATAIACNITGWAVVEASLAKVFASILHASPVSATALEDAHSFERRAALVNRVATVELPADDADLVAAVLSIVRPFSGIRNSFAHGIWLVPKHLPGQLLLADSAFAWSFHVQGLSAGLRQSGALARTIQDAKHRIESAKPYSLPELHKLVGQIGGAGDLVTALSNCVGEPALPTDDRSRMRGFIASHPAVANALKIRAERRRVAEAQSSSRQKSARRTTNETD